MRTILISGSDYATSRQLHQALKMMLKLPDYYGLNADALNDCLEESGETVNLWIAGEGEGETAAALEKISRVITDNGGRVTKL